MQGWVAEVPLNGVGARDTHSLGQPCCAKRVDQASLRYAADARLLRAGGLGHPQRLQVAGTPYKQIRHPLLTP